MIQRIQSLYFVLAQLCMMAFLFLPVIAVRHIESGIAASLAIIDRDELSGKWGIRNVWGNAEDFLAEIFTPVALACFLLTVILLAIILFSYKKRSFQLRWSKIVMVILLILMAFTLFYIFGTNPGAEIEIVYPKSIAVFMPFLAWIFSYLGYKGVKKDDDLIKSTDRIR